MRSVMNIGWAWMLALAFSQANAAQFRIVDQNGQPVPNAVLISDSAQETTPLTPLAPAIMDQVDKQFSPHVLVVRKGQAVNFPNSDDIRHHVYSFSKPNHFEIKLYRHATTEPVRFDTAGVVVLGCNIHDGMKGYIFVTDNGHAVVSDENGHASLAVQEVKSYAIWHSRLAQGVVEPVPVTVSHLVNNSAARVDGGAELSSQGKALASIDEGMHQIVISLQPVVADRKKQFRARFK